MHDPAVALLIDHVAASFSEPLVSFQAVAFLQGGRVHKFWWGRLVPPFFGCYVIASHFLKFAFQQTHEAACFSKVCELTREVFDDKKSIRS